jgi:hypothetical protein
VKSTDITNGTLARIIMSILISLGGFSVTQATDFPWDNENFKTTVELHLTELITAVQSHMDIRTYITHLDRAWVGIHIKHASLSAKGKFLQLCTLLDAPETFYFDEQNQKESFSPQEKLYIKSRFTCVDPQMLVAEDLFCPTKTLVDNFIPVIQATRSERELAQLVAQISKVHQYDKMLFDAVIRQRRYFAALQTRNSQAPVFLDLGPFKQQHPQARFVFVDEFK